MSFQSSTDLPKPDDSKQAQRFWRENLYKRIKISASTLDRIIAGLTILILLLILWSAFS